jgi:hypothetical protein
MNFDEFMKALVSVPKEKIAKKQSLEKAMAQSKRR